MRLRWSHLEPEASYLYTKRRKCQECVLICEQTIVVAIIIMACFHIYNLGFMLPIPNRTIEDIAPLGCKVLVNRCPGSASMEMVAAHNGICACSFMGRIFSADRRLGRKLAVSQDLVQSWML